MKKLQATDILSKKTNIQFKTSRNNFQLRWYVNSQKYLATNNSNFSWPISSNPYEKISKAKHEQNIFKKIDIKLIKIIKNHKITYIIKNIKVTNYVSFPFKIFTNLWNEKIVIKGVVLIIAPIVLHYSIGDLFLIFS